MTIFEDPGQSFFRAAAQAQNAPEGPTRPYIDCPECPHSHDQHASLQGCHGDANTCPCTESQASLLVENQ